MLDIWLNLDWVLILFWVSEWCPLCTIGKSISVNVAYDGEVLVRDFRRCVPDSFAHFLQHLSQTKKRVKIIWFGDQLLAARSGPDPDVSLCITHGLFSGFGIGDHLSGPPTHWFDPAQVSTAVVKLVGECFCDHYETALSTPKLDLSLLLTFLSACTITISILIIILSWEIIVTNRL